MVAENFQAKDDFGQVQRVKQFTTGSGAITYTAKTGRAADDFVIDRVLRVTSTADYALTITLPNGVYYGQLLTVVFEVLGDNETIDIDVDTGTDSTQLDAAGEWTVMQYLGGTIGWKELATNAT